MTLPLLMKAENKYSDHVNVLDQLEAWTDKIYEASGLCQNPQGPHNASDWLKLQLDRINPEAMFLQHPPMMTRDLRSGSHTAKQQLDHLYHIVGWHTWKFPQGI